MRTEIYQNLITLARDGKETKAYEDVCAALGTSELTLTVKKYQNTKSKGLSEIMHGDA